MSAKMFEIMSRKTIKPASPTPQNLKTFKLSSLDQQFPAVYGLQIFFYHSDTNTSDDVISSFLQKSRRLQNSLSDVLIHYYPLAGKLVDDSCVECNDDGGFFLEARMNCQLSHFLSQPDVQLLNQYFVPTKDPEFVFGSCMLAIQFTLFNCGGVAISVCPSHKIVDGASFYTFLNSWIATAMRQHEKMVAPIFVDSSFSLQEGFLGLPTPEIPPPNFVTKRFLFHASKIASLKAKIVGAMHQPLRLSKVDVVLALIMKCAISSSRSASKSSGPSLVYHLMNARTKMVPPLPENTMGNIMGHIPLVFEENEVELNELAGKIRKSLKEICSSHDHNARKPEERGEMLSKDMTGINSYVCTSLCGFPLYEMDFGWGKPLWATGPTPLKNLIYLTDTRQGGGVEAWVTFHEKEMAKFECHDEVVAFASFNPSAFTIKKDIDPRSVIAYSRL